MSDLFLEREDDFLSLHLKAKELTPQVKWVITQRRGEYVESLLKLYKHRSLQVRREVAKGLATLGHKEALPILREWQVQEDDRRTWLLVEAAIDRLERREFESEEIDETRVLSVGEALEHVKNLITYREYVVEGELSDVRAIYQMYYFTLKDEQETGLSCRIFEGKVLRAGFPLNEGLSVRVTGKFNLSKYSKLVFEIHKIELTGEGELLRNLQLLEQKLEGEGLFDPQRKRQPVSLPRRVLLLASPNSAAIKDFTQVLERRRGGIQIYHLPIKTQGVGAESEILEKLEAANKYILELDVDTVVITRGGGSKDDLFIFNSERVVRHIYGLKAPSIVAIGHERDWSLAEKAADVRAATPSQAAELTSFSSQEILSKLENWKQFAYSYVRQRSQEYKTAADRFWQKSWGLTSQRVSETKEVLRVTDSVVEKMFSLNWQRAKDLWQRIYQQVAKMLYEVKIDFAHIPNLTKNKQEEVDRYHENVQASYARSYQSVWSYIQEVQYQVSWLYQQILWEDSRQVLQKGYAIVRQEGEIVTNIRELDTAKKISLEFVDGEVEIN